MVGSDDPRSHARTLVYGHGHDGLIFAHEQVALATARRLHLLWTSRTWSEVEAAVDVYEFEHICNLYREYGDPAFDADDEGELDRPEPDAPFSGPGYFESYPSYALGDPTELNSCLPSEILNRFAEQGDAEYMKSLIIDSSAERIILGELKRAGFNVRLDEELIEAAWDPDAAAAVMARPGSET
jgi:hypothetical protein